MKLIITIDTEEDAWGNYKPTGHTVENIQKVPSLQQLFDDFKVKPTYLIDYPVASDLKAVEILRRILADGRCEIGAHLHPWNTPPFEEETTARHSMLCNLPADLQLKKIKFLHKTIQEQFGIEPLSFRAGRWGYSQEVARSLYSVGYKVDTSITPYTDWSDSFGPDYSNISPKSYYFSSENIFEESSDPHLLEIPATIGYFQKNFSLCNHIWKMATKKPISRFKLGAVLYKLHLVNPVWLSPEVSSAKNMIKLAQRMIKNNYPFINLFFHSPSLQSGLSPFVQSKAEEKQFLEKIREFLVFTQNSGIESIKLSDAVL